MGKFHKVIIILAATIFTGCSINHPIANDYGQYLENNQGNSLLPKSEIEAEYSISEQTLNHRYEFRAATVGYAHLWIVEFGDILTETLKSKDVQEAFGGLSETKGGIPENLIVFNLENYEFKNHHAYVSLNIALAKSGQVIFEKMYHSEGLSQGGKMFWGGPFAMKNATQQSTKLAIDKIISEFLDDVNKKVLGQNSLTNQANVES